MLNCGIDRRLFLIAEMRNCSIAELTEASLLKSRNPAMAQFRNVVLAIQQSRNSAMWFSQSSNRTIRNVFLFPQFAIRNSQCPSFTFPFDRWMKGPWRKMVEETLLGPGASPGVLFDRGAVAQLWRDYLAGRVHWSRPWAKEAPRPKR